MDHFDEVVRIIPQVKQWTCRLIVDEVDLVPLLQDNPSHRLLTGVYCTRSYYRFDPHIYKGMGGRTELGNALKMLV